jgi:UPF0755 protein
MIFPTINIRIKIAVISLFVILLGYLNYQIFIPVKDFPVGKIFEIEKGQSAGEIFSNLEKEGYIRDATWAKVLNKIFRYAKFYPGEYEFEKPESTYDVVFNITKRPVSYAVLIPEGFTKKQVAERVAKYVKNFDQKKFLAEAQEGYLFPDTYYFFKYSTAEEVLKEMSDKFNKETFLKLGKVPTKSEIIIASMLEREARGPNDMKIIAGIYYNRLEIGMPLQVDATVLYGQGAWKERTLYKDLKHDSDYNTYKNKGLPIGPISNPGISALTAAMNPTENDYLYYLTGKDGKMYYAKTFEQHVQNRKYLK